MKKEKENFCERLAECIPVRIQQAGENYMSATFYLYYKNGYGFIAEPYVVNDFGEDPFEPRLLRSFKRQIVTALEYILQGKKGFYYADSWCCINEEGDFVSKNPIPLKELVERYSKAPSTLRHKDDLYINTPIYEEEPINFN